MKKTLLFLFVSSLASLGFTSCSKSEKQQVAELQKNYHLVVCPVSGAKLGEMGKPVDYLYKKTDANGKADTELVRFCCPGCVDKFNASPDQYLQKVHAAN